MHSFPGSTHLSALTRDSVPGMQVSRRMSFWSHWQWQRWSWDEIYLALARERFLGEGFEIEHELVTHPLACGAHAGSGQEGWDYRFEGPEGEALYVEDRGDHYVAYLDEAGPRPTTPGVWGGVTVASAPSRLGVAAAAGVGIFLAGVTLAVGSALASWM